MAIQDHIHLGKTQSDAESQVYWVRHKGLDETPKPPNALEYGITGVAHHHYLDDGSGHPTIMDYAKLVIICDGDDKDTLIGMAGHRVHYVPIDHVDNPDETPSTTPVEMILRVNSNQNIDPMANWWMVAIELMDAHTVTA
jgi:hypothetical protein